MSHPSTCPDCAALDSGLGLLRRSTLEPLHMNVRNMLFALTTISGLALGCEKPTEPAPPTEAVVQPAAAAPATPTAPVLPTPPAGARVFFIEPTDGAEVKGPLVDGKVA